MLKTTYDYNKADEKTLDAMRDRCHEQGHEWENGASFGIRYGGPSLIVYQFCKWCGERG